MINNIIYLLLLISTNLQRLSQAIFQFYQFFCSVANCIGTSLCESVHDYYWNRMNGAATATMTMTMPLNPKMYTFRPFELTKVEYKNYNAVNRGRGINFYPKARSGHRIVCNDTNIYCFGGYNPSATPIRMRTQYLFQEMWQYNLMTKRWRQVFGHNHDNMPEELASNAIVWKDELIIVRVYRYIKTDQHDLS